MPYVNASPMVKVVQVPSAYYTFAPGTWYSESAELLPAHEAGLLARWSPASVVGLAQATRQVTFVPVGPTGDWSTRPQVAAIQATADEIEHITSDQIELHLHNHEYWWGIHSAYAAPNDCGEIASSVVFTLTSGDDNPVTGEWVYGAWVCILGANDTPHRAGAVVFDPHSINVIDVSIKNIEYKLQFADGADAPACNAAVAVGGATELILAGQDTKTGDRILHTIEERHTAGVPFWARCAARGQDSATCGFFIGTHEYDR